MAYPPQLIELIEFEKKTTFYKVYNDVQIEIKGLAPNVKITNFSAVEKLKVHLKLNDFEFKTSMDLKFIHQIGSRIEWIEGTSNYTLKQITNFWINDIIENSNLESIKSKIKNVFRRKDLVIIYVGESNPYNIYGIVSNSYVPTNQLEFRDRFIQLCKEKNTIINTENSSIHYNKDFKSVTEYFEFNNNENHIFKLSCGIIYGKNNGYGSYSVVWKREVNETKSVYLPFVTEERFNWQNNPRYVNLPNEGINHFIDTVVEQGLLHQKYLEERVEKLLQEDISANLIKDFFGKALSRILVAKATKDRVIEQWQEEYLVKNSNFKNTKWAISESLTFVGTHNKAVPESMKKLLRQAGTEIFDLGFEKFLETYETKHLTLKANFGIDH